MKYELRNEKTDELVCQIDTKSKKGTYYCQADCDTAKKLTPTISLTGFERLPKGFSTLGYGFLSPAAWRLIDRLNSAFGSGISLTVTTAESKIVRRRKSPVHVYLNHTDYLTMLDIARDIRTEKNAAIRGHIDHVLGEVFPKHFDRAPIIDTRYIYEDDKLTKLLSDDEIVEQLSKSDVETIASIYGKLADLNRVDFDVIGVAKDSKDRNERIYLESVIEEFEKRLSKTLSESDWQRFLQKYILLFNTSYVHAIEKMSVDLKGKYPDFILVNVYGYLDIYEIKKPSTTLLRHDPSRDNYFWDTEVSKAITQTEKYIQMLVRESLRVKELILEKHGIDVKVIRPRGYVVVGQSSQFVDKKMEDDFRLLAGALKNVDIVLYDELLAGLKNLTTRLSDE